MIKSIKFILNYFQPDKVWDNRHAHWLSRILVGFLVTLLAMLAAMEIAIICGLILEEFPCIEMSFALLGLLLLYKKTGSQQIVVNLIVLLIIVVNQMHIAQTGHIYTFNLRWMIIPLMVSFLFLDLKYSVLWIAVIVGLVYYNYDVSTLASKEIAFHLDATYFLVDNLFYVITFSLLFIPFYYSQRRLNFELASKNRLLETQKIELQEKTDSLNSLTGKLQESNMKLENYAHTTAHDLKQPLSNIARFAQLARRDLDQSDSGDKSKQHLETITDSSRRLVGMIDNLLLFAKASYDKGKDIERFDLGQSVNLVLQSLSNLIKEKNAQIVVSELPFISSHKALIERVLLNLISNALKYSRPNIAPVIEITMKVTEATYLFAVKDNGIGIDQSKLERVFNPFDRLDQMGNSGHGVGLANCKSMVKEHEGKIWVESEKGIGSTFFFSLPKKIAQKKADTCSP